MQLRDVFANMTLPGEVPDGVMIEGLASDSRLVRDGYLFAALDGGVHRGDHFVDDAVARGARAVLSGRVLPDVSVPVIVHRDPRYALAQCARQFFHYVPDYIAAVTGTNGKTSIAHFLRHIWEQAHLNAASMGTLGVQRGAMSEALQHTTPDPIVLHQHLRNLYAEGVTHCILEASSHGLDQRRLDGLRVRLAGFTNLTHDHLDYHATEEIYFAAKARLFTELLDAEGGAVIFTDHAAGQKMADAVRAAGRAVLTVGTSEADLTVTQISRHMSGQKLSFTYEGQSCEANLAVIGDFQLENLGVAVGMAMASGIHLSDIDLSALTAPPGRMQWAGESAHAAHVYVDYAHTPDALLRVLQTVRKHAEGRVMVVFGCGGDRDQDKRGAMGAIADREADIVFVTDDNPRGEDGAKIRAMILAQCPRAIEVPDRRAAIQQAVAAGQAGDIIVVAGKGHETGQIIGQQVLPFDDLKEVRRALGGDGGAGDIVQGGVDG